MKNTKLGENYDVIVVGGGPAGCGAAIAAGRAGAKVLLIEQMNCLGGMWTSGFVNPMFDHENKRGLIKELRETFQAQNLWGGLWNKCFDYETMKLTLESMAEEAGVTLLYYTTCIDVEKAENRVTGVVVENIGGRTLYRGKVIIDATGDARVAADAGAEFRLGSDEDGSCQALTLMFLVRLVPEKYRAGKMFYEQIQNAFDKEGAGNSAPYTMPFIIPIPGSDMAVVQYTHMRGCDVLSAEDLTKATVEGRRQANLAVHALRTYDEDFKDFVLIQTAPMLGVRESRRIVGEYTLTVQDLISGAQFEDGVTTATFNIDIHEPGNVTQTCQKVQPYQIPYRCMIPKGLDGLLVAGRCISGDHVAMASYRVTSNCTEMGEAAGYAAYESVVQNKNLRDVSIQEINRHFPQE